MPREAKVTYEDIARACVRIIGRGKPATVDAVYEEVGRISSRSTINRLRNEFLENFQKQGLSVLPAALPEGLIPAIEEFWSVARLEAGRSYSEQESQYEARLSDAADQLTGAQETIAVQEKMLQDRQRELRLAHEAKTDVSEKLVSATTDLRAQEALIDRLREDKDRLNQKLADERTEADRRYDQAREDWEREKQAFVDALEALKKSSAESEAKQERLTDYWTMQVADSREQVSEVKQRMQEEKERHNQDLSLERKRGGQLSNQVDRLLGEREDLEGRLTEKEDELRVQGAQNQELNEHITDLIGQCADLKERLQKALDELATLKESKPNA
ncbi:hypothetical protein AWH63_10135 [Marinobacter sp. C18]|uniref:DNA-binding protein n=1 Tax=Marinobacter sp. C18 TaxID=1772288 RepID=UPI000948A0C5|nr:DNA-binding protein [Marinobacter sp. C18]OLF81893.1 hypothetical protein AWH63_10135 [Marinobacter sp. C18]